MGASFSSVSKSENPVAVLSLPSKPGLGDLPESCAALILGYLDPPEICKLANLNRAFRGASWADFIWESKMPSNYQTIVGKVFGDGLENLGKRDVFTRLCQPNSFDDGTKTVWLDKSTGSVCLSISSKGLAITGIDDRRYWNHIPTEESRSSMPKIKKNLWQSLFFEVITFFNMIAIILMIDVNCLDKHNLLSHYLHIEVFPFCS
ncbi:F-box protein PP2-A12-like [Pyrus ussuriensis x Pyrus communis]|uniref:F-box protein PP2-A12-like n=1 Tax=Pyrus ussuriensis x Pyrus communis TaxID=2448454 RepID=A0A5N5HHG5_9ROSA|nr:F-box protein PP2-A12-like [Pyrus ussuriensis x Pyrus communis]